VSFTQKLISITLTLANGQFGSSGGNSMTLSGLRTSVRIRVPGGQSMGVLEGAIYGMSLSTMNQLSTVGTQLNAQAKNTISVMAGDAETGMALVYSGTLKYAYVDAQSMPQVAFRVSGSAGAYEAVKPVKPTSIQGAGDVAQVMSQLAGQMNLSFENNGVNVKLSNIYLSGSARMQALTLAQHAGIEHLIDKGTLAIWKPGQGRQSSSLMISPQTGMVGYPMFNQANVVVRTLFNPAINYGGLMQIQSDLTPACGTWAINYVDLELDSMVPHGRWFATLSGTPTTAPQISP
jgi:hypothetical protein